MKTLSLTPLQSLAVSLLALLALSSVALAQPKSESKTEPAKETVQEAEPKSDPKKENPAPVGNSATSKTPLEVYQAVNARWTATDKRLTEIASSYAAAMEPQKAELKAEYLKLVAESEKLLPELRTAALAALQTEPNKHPDVLRTVLGLINYDNRRDLHEDALATAKKLIDAGCEEPVLFALAGTAAFRMDDYEAAEKYLTKADQAGKLDRDSKQYLDDLPEQKKAWAAELAIREKEAKANDLPRVKLETNKGTILIELFENEAPGAVGNFVSLVERKYYDGLTFHRVLPNFMAQGGDPDGTGGGGPGYQIYCETDKPNARKHFRGTLSMAHAGKDTGGSQFFLTFRPTPHLNPGKSPDLPGHTVFGRVIEGMDVLAKLQRRDPTGFNPPPPDRIVKAEVVRKREHAYEPNKVK